jgi:predicted PurR-regulated permease PerM
MEQNEQFELLLKESKKRNFYLRIVVGCMLAMVIIFLASACIVVPRAVESFNTLNESAATFDAAVTEMHELTVQLKDTNLLLQDFVNENANTLTEIITKINKVDFDALNEAIDGLRDTVEPFANFMNFFKK